MNFALSGLDCTKCGSFPCDGLKNALKAVGGLSAIDNFKAQTKV